MLRQAKPILKPAPVSFDSSAPKTLLDLYHQHFQEHRDHGHSHEESHRRAIRHTQIAGWHKTSRGWKQLHPDLRDKVNVREAVKQPNGRYVIEDVDVFYPNAAKGKQLAFDADDIRQIIDNTNRGIHAGGQKPGLIEGHPNELQGAMGTQLDTHGFGVNWRESPRGKGWARCHLIDVDEPTVQRLQNRRLPGLSAALAADTGKLNRRFGHVALLGGTTQALSHLPTHEVFSVSGNYVCFSADLESFPKGNPMKLSDKQKSCYAALHSAYEAYEAAEKSHELGEPGGEEKMKEAFGHFSKAHDAYDAEMAGENPMAPIPSEGPSGNPVGPVGGAAEEGNGTAAAAYAEAEQGGTEASQNHMPADAPAFAADPEAAFSAWTSRVQDVEGKLAKAMKVIEVQNRKNVALETKQRWQQFSADVDGLRKAGHAMPPGEIVKAEFDACYQARDPEAALQLKLKSYKSLPRGATAATVNGGQPVFSAEDASKARDPKKPSLKDLEGIMPTLSEDDMKWAALGAGTFAAAE